MDIPMDAQVYCTDGECGMTMGVVMDPTSQKVTHVIVKEKDAPHTERLIPEGFILDADDHHINLDLTLDSFSNLDEFIEKQFVRATVPRYSYQTNNIMLWPYSVPEEKDILVPVENIPVNELALQRGSRVKAVDGMVGQIDELVVDEKDGHVTYIVLREGHLWGQRDVSIPVSEIARINENVVHLKLTKDEVEALPVQKLHRSYF